MALSPWTFRVVEGRHGEWRRTSRRYHKSRAYPPTERVLRSSSGGVCAPPRLLRNERRSVSPTPRNYERRTRSSSRKVNSCPLGKFDHVLEILRGSDLDGFIVAPFFLSFFLFLQFEKNFWIFPSFGASKEIGKFRWKRYVETKMKNGRWRNGRSFISLCLRFFFSDSLRILSRKWNVGEMQVVRDWKKFGTRFVFVSESKKRFENFVEKMERIFFVLLSYFYSKRIVRIDNCSSNDA